MKAEDKRALVVWVALIVITCISVFAAETVSIVGVVTTVVVVLGYLKARLIFVNYMELHRKAKPYRAILEVWGIAAVLIILVPYWAGLF